MVHRNSRGKVNVKLLIILIVVVVALGVSLVAARQIRRSILSRIAFEQGTEAFEKGDWVAAYEQLQEYLGRNPDDIEVLKKYGQARLYVQPLELPHIRQAIAAFRRVMQLAPTDEMAYDKLGKLYAGVGNFEELAYIARRRLEQDPNDMDAPLRLADALIQLNKVDEAVDTLNGFMARCDPNEHGTEYATEYAKACLKMAMLAEREDDIVSARISENADPDGPTTPLDWLDKAIEAAPRSTEALATRAQFHRLGSRHADPNLSAARRDLETASALEFENPRIYYALCTEWIAHGELEKAAAILEAAKRVPDEIAREHFLDLRGWTTMKFALAAELSLRQGQTQQGAQLADEMLETFDADRQRLKVLPYAIQLFLVAGRIDVDEIRDANDCLDEYIDILYANEAEMRRLKSGTDYLSAWVARAKGDSYGVIDILQPTVASGVSDDARVWRLLADAFIQTNQPRRAVEALVNYLGRQPRDPEMTLKLAREYLKLNDFNRAFETARLGETVDPTDVLLKLLRIEAGVFVAEQEQTLNEAGLAALAEELTDLREEHPERVDIRIRQAMIAAYRERPEEAETELKLAIEECDEPLRAEMQLVQHYHRLKRIDDAIRVCRQACERHPEVSEPWLSLAGLYASQQNQGAAIACLEEANDAVVGRWEKRAVAMRLATQEVLYRNRERGIERLRKVADSDPREVRARTLLLGVAAVENDADKAQTLIDELRAAEGESGMQWRLHQASLWLASDNWRAKQQEIADLLQYCVTADPKWSLPYLVLTDMYEKLDDLQRVESVCRQALSRNPAATDIADKLIDTLEKQGRLNEAMEVADQADADSRVKSNWRVGGALAAGDLSQAVEELQLRIGNDNQDAQSRILLARLLYAQDPTNADRALGYLDEAEDIAGVTLTTTAVRASILRAKGQQAEARQILDDYVTHKDDFDAHVLRAAYFAREGETENAEAEFRKLTDDPNRGDVGYLLLSSFYAKTERLDKAIGTLEEGCEKVASQEIKSARDPNGLALKRGLMKALFLRRQPEDREKAKRLLAELERNLPEDPELLKYRAMELLNEYKVDPDPEVLTAAKAKLEEVVQAEPTAVKAHLALIGIYAQAGDYESAKDYVTRAIGSNPDDVDLLAARAEIELALKNRDLAVELARMVLRDDPTNATALGIIVAVAQETRTETLLEQAGQVLETALADDPNNEQLLISRARILVFLKQPEKAIPELEQYCQTEAGRQSINAIVTLADLYRLTGNQEQAGQKLEQAAKIDENNLNVLHARLLLLVTQGQLDEANKLVDAYLSAPAEDVTMVVKAATVLAATDSTAMKKQGVKLFKHALSLAPGLLNARVGLATTLYQVGDSEGAKQAYQKVLEDDPENVQALNDLAWILQESEQRYAEALELANRGLSLAPDNPHLLDTKATIESKMSGQTDDGK